MDTESSKPPAETSLEEPELLAPSESMARRVTQRDVAAAAGLHSTTVSLALRGSSRISPVTRERVRRIASSVGFVPDPLIGAFVAHRERVCGRCGSETSAFVTFGAGETAANDCLAGVRASAARLGFKVDHLAGGDTNRSHRRLRQILYHRRIEGVILYYADEYAFEWCDFGEDRFSVVAIGHPDGGLPFHRVAFNCFGAIRAALGRARQMGCRRIGLVATGAAEERCMRALAADAAGAGPDGVAETATYRMAPAVGWAGTDACEAEAGRLGRWLRGFQPEVILGVARKVRPYLHALGLRVPGDVSMLDLDRHDSDRSLAGVVHSHRAAGSVAFDVLHRLLRQGVRGIPRVATRTLVDGTWHLAAAPDDGSSTIDPVIPAHASNLGAGAAVTDVRDGDAVG